MGTVELLQQVPKVRSYLSLRVLGVVFCAGLFCTLPEASRGEEDVRQQVLAAWQRKRETLPAVQCEISGKELYVKGSVVIPMQAMEGKPPQPAADCQFPFQSTMCLDLQHQWFKRKSEDHNWAVPSENFIHFSRVYLFDGEQFQRLESYEENTGAAGAPRLSQPVLHVLVNEPSPFHTRVEDWPVFLAHGVFHLPHELPMTRKLVLEVRPEDFRVLQAPGAPDGRLIRLRTTQIDQGQFHEVLIDPGKDFSVVKLHSFTAQDEPTHRMEINYQQVGSTWYPKDWKCEDYSPVKRNTLLSVHWRKLESVTFHPGFQVEDFRPTVQPGMTVVDNKERKTYRIAEDGKSHTPLFTIPEAKHDWRRPLLSVALLVGTLGVLAAVLFVRRKRAAKSRSS
jgi:hypothetical protein